MKKIRILLCWSLSFGAFADITPPTANYILSGDVVIDAQGEINDDPEQVVTLNSAETPIVKANVASVNANQEKSWIKRHDGCVARANRNHALIK